MSLYSRLATPTKTFFVLRHSLLVFGSPLISSRFVPPTIWNIERSAGYSRTAEPLTFSPAKPKPIAACPTDVGASVASRFSPLPL